LLQFRYLFSFFSCGPKTASPGFGPFFVKLSMFPLFQLSIVFSDPRLAVCFVFFSLVFSLYKLRFDEACIRIMDILVLPWMGFVGVVFFLHPCRFYLILLSLLTEIFSTPPPLFPLSTHPPPILYCYFFIGGLIFTINLAPVATPHDIPIPMAHFPWALLYSPPHLQYTPFSHCLPGFLGSYPPHHPPQNWACIPPHSSDLQPPPITQNRIVFSLLTFLVNPLHKVRPEARTSSCGCSFFFS